MSNGNGGDESQLDQSEVTPQNEDGGEESDQVRRKTSEEKSVFCDEAEELPDLGLFQLTLIRAANLIAADLWLQDEDASPVPGFGEWEAPAPENPDFLRTLEPHPTMLLERLIQSIVNGSLSCSRLAVDLMTGAIIPERTYVQFYVLTAWLAQHDYHLGEHFENFEEQEVGIRREVVGALFDIRNVRANLLTLHDETKPWHDPMLIKTLWECDENGNETAENLRTIIRAYAAQVRYLNQQLGLDRGSRAETGLHPKARNSLCRVILALCSRAKIDPTSRSAVSEIVRATEEVDLEVGDDTVRKILREVRAITPR